jgi:hypothetical protein
VASENREERLNVAAAVARILIARVAAVVANCSPPLLQFSNEHISLSLHTLAAALRSFVDHPQEVIATVFASASPSSSH